MEPGPGTFPKLPPIPDQNLCVQVYTHATWNGSGPSAGGEPEHNDLLAWIGVTVLELAIRDKLYSERPHRSNDGLTVGCGEFMKRENLAQWAELYRLPERLRCSASQKPQLISDLDTKVQLFQAYVGAVFQRDRLTGVEEWIHPLMDAFPPARTGQNISASYQDAPDASRNVREEAPRGPPDRFNEDGSVQSGSSFTAETESIDEDGLVGSFAGLEFLHTTRSRTPSDGTLTPPSSPRTPPPPPRGQSQRTRATSEPIRTENLRAFSSSTSRAATAPPEVYTQTPSSGLVNGRSPLMILNELQMQHRVQSVHWGEPTTPGPPHMLTWSVTLIVDGISFTGRFHGKKQDARAEAALLALRRLHFV